MERIYLEESRFMGGIDMFNVGDKVRIRKNVSRHLDANPHDRDAIETHIGIAEAMIDGEFCNMDFIITRKIKGSWYYPDESVIMVYRIEDENGNDTGYAWTEEFFEPKEIGFWLLDIDESETGYTEDLPDNNDDLLDDTYDLLDDTEDLLDDMFSFPF